MNFKSDDAVAITCAGNTVTGTVLAASADSHSLALGFDGVVDGYLRIMSVMRDRKGIYRTLNNTPVILRPRDNPAASNPT